MDPHEEGHLQSASKECMAEGEIPSSVTQQQGDSLSWRTSLANHNSYDWTPVRVCLFFLMCDLALFVPLQ